MKTAPRAPVTITGTRFLGLIPLAALVVTALQAFVSPALAAPPVFTTNMDATTVVGQADFVSNLSTPSQVGTSGSSASAISATGKLAVADIYPGRVLIWNTVPTTNGVPANVVVGRPDFTSATLGTTASLLNGQSYGVAFSPDGGKLLVSDWLNHRVLIWNTVPTTNGVAADVVIGQADFTTGTAGTTSSALSRPTGVMVTPAGKLLIADYGNHRVLVYNTIPTTNNAVADLVIGQPDFTTGTQGNTASKMNNPGGMALNPSGKLLVADAGNNRVLVFNTVPTSNGASADVVIGQTGFGTSAGGTTATTLRFPFGVAVSPSGKLAIADFNNSRVLVYNSIPTTNGATANIVLGQPGFTSSTASNGGVTAHSMATAYGVTFASDERLLVADRGENRLMIFGSPGTVPTVTLNTANLGSNATTLTITGTNFSTTAANNTVVFSPTGTGTVTSSTATSLTVTSITGLTTGALHAVVTTNGYVSTSTQVATVIAPASPPVGTSASTTLAASGTYSFNLASWGFTDPGDSPANNFVAAKITALPTVGTLTYNGSPVTLNQVLSVLAAGPAGATWIDYSGSSGSRAWTSVACTPDGIKLVACEYDGLIYTSPDAGQTWTTKLDSSGVHSWTSVATSADGTKLVASEDNESAGGYIYTSADGGVTWTTNSNSSGIGLWTSVASSSDGNKLVACDQSHYIYTSTNGGVTWTTNSNSSGTGGWASVASSADGTKLVAGDIFAGFIHTSTDSGVTWTTHGNSSLAGFWQCVASSPDGTKLAACEYPNGFVYTSANGGVTWTSNSSSSGQNKWRSVAISADGTKLVACVYNGVIYTSANSGVTWTTNSNSSGGSKWYGVASSSDGSRLYACDNAGSIRTSSGATLPIVYTAPANAAGLAYDSLQFKVVDNGTVGFDTATTPATFTFNAPAPAPTVTNVTSSTADGSFKAGVVIPITVTFSASVTVTGNPTLALNSGGSATYVSGSPGTDLMFNYTVLATQNSADLDYSVTTSLALAGGTINATSGGTAATLTLPVPAAAGSLGNNKAIVIDTTAPTIVSVNRLTPSGQTTALNTMTFHVTYSEPVMGVTTASFAVIPVNGSNIAGTVDTVTGTGNTRDVSVTITSGAGEFRLRGVD